MGVSKNHLEIELVGQTGRSGKLPTMYDLPSEDSVFSLWHGKFDDITRTWLCIAPRFLDHGEEFDRRYQEANSALAPFSPQAL
jgi:hypothetical protein